MAPSRTSAWIVLEEPLRAKKAEKQWTHEELQRLLDFHHVPEEETEAASTNRPVLLRFSWMELPLAVGPDMVPKGCFPYTNL